MKYYLPLLLFFLQGDLAARAVQYTLSPVFNSQQTLLALRVQLEMMGDADGTTQLQLPDQFGPANHLYRCISRIRSLSSQSIAFSADSLSVIVQHLPGTSIQLSYEVKQDVPGTLMTATNSSRPFISGSNFQVLGAALFIIPLAPSDGYQITFTWQQFPTDWTLHSSFGPELQQQWSAPDVRWLESVFTGGADWRRYQTVVQGKPVFLTILGEKWAFSDSLLVETLRNIVACQRAFWNDFDIPSYTVTLLPIDQPDSKVYYSGVGLNQSFATCATPEGLQLSHLQHLFHHELMHHWIGGKIRNGGAANDMQFAWFSEGFTEYFSWQNQLRCGLIDSAYYAHQITARYFKTLWQSPNAQQPNSWIADHFWDQPEARLLPYQRGFVMAFYLNQLIEQHSRGKRHLSDAMQKILAWYSTDNRSLAESPTMLLKLITTETGENVDPLYKKYIVEGKLIPPSLLKAPQGFLLKIHAEGYPVLTAH